MRDRGTELLRITPVTRFADLTLMAETVRDLRADGYQCAVFDCAAWSDEADFHLAMAAALKFPPYYGRNLDAFNDSLSNVEIAGYRGMALAFANWESFARIVGHDDAWAVLDIIADRSRLLLVYGKRLLALLHVPEQVQFEPVGEVRVERPCPSTPLEDL